VTLTKAPLVVEVNTRFNQAIDPATPAGITAALAALLPGTRHVRMEPEGELPRLGAGLAAGHEPEGERPRLGAGLAAGRQAAAGPRPVVLVVHDAARHSWVRDRVARAVRERPDVIVVDTGIPAAPAGAVHLATHGISRVSAQAAAEWLTS